jgi:hypothetical protein
MSSPQWLKKLPALGLEFWLSLPLLGIIFWTGGGLLANQLLSRPYGSVDKLEADRELEVQLSLTVLVIQADIYTDLGLTKVEIKTTDSALKELEFEFLVTEVSQVEAMIAQELRLSQEDVRKLVRYRLKN